MSELRLRLSMICEVDLSWKRPADPTVFAIGFRPAIRFEHDTRYSEKQAFAVERVGRVIEIIREVVGVEPDPTSFLSREVLRTQDASRTRPGKSPAENGFVYYTHDDSLLIGRALGIRAADSPILCRLLGALDSENFGEPVKIARIKCKTCWAEQDVRSSPIDAFLFTQEDVKLSCGCVLKEGSVEILGIKTIPFEGEPVYQTWPIHQGEAPDISDAVI